MQRDGIHHTFISKETHQPSLSFKIDANYSVYSFDLLVHVILKTNLTMPAN